MNMFRNYQIIFSLVLKITIILVGLTLILKFGPTDEQDVAVDEAHDTKILTENTIINIKMNVELDAIFTGIIEKQTAN